MRARWHALGASELRALIGLYQGARGASGGAAAEEEEAREAASFSLQLELAMRMSEAELAVARASAVLGALRGPDRLGGTPASRDSTDAALADALSAAAAAGMADADDAALQAALLLSMSVPEGAAPPSKAW